MAANTQFDFTVWNRLEPSIRKANFDKSLKAEIRDPLWMLTRQWQFGEFVADDAGSPVFAKVRMQTAKVHQVSLQGNAPIVYDEGLTLEAHVERERVPFQFDIPLRIEIGRHWNRLVKQHLLDGGTSAANIQNVLDAFQNSPEFRFEIPNDGVEGARFLARSTLKSALTLLQARRGIDGSKVYLDLKENAGTVINNLVDPAFNPLIQQAGNDLLAWFERTYQQPENVNQAAWNPSKLTYEVSCAVPEADGSMTILQADEFHHGKLDAYAFSVQKDTTKVHPDLLTPATSPDVEEEVFSFIPSPVKFAGMPNPRWWEFEDSLVDLGDLDIMTTDMGKVLFAEFGLIYSNDWFVLPYDIKAGSLCQTNDLIITDVFGQRTCIQPSLTDNESDWLDWSMFSLNTSDGGRDNRLFAPPAIAFMQQSDPLEEVNFIRDEMANMVWAIENGIPDDMGQMIDGRLASAMEKTYLENYFSNGNQASLTSSLGDLKYSMLSNVPENWIPFVPARSGAIDSRDIQLRRAAMPRNLEGLPDDQDQRVRPKSSLLRVNFSSNGKPDGPYFIHEEEVPRAGTHVVQTWQRTRNEKGDVLVWLGRRKRNQRKVSGSVSLKFDRLVQI